MGNKCQKSTILAEKSKITKNCQKSWKFSKIWLLSPRIWLVAQTCTPLPKIWPLLKKNFFSDKKWIFLTIFPKKSHFDPPNLQKVQQREVQSKSAIRKKSFFRRFKAACKKLEKVTIRITRTVPKIFFGYICKESRNGRGPYPCPTW